MPDDKAEYSEPSIAHFSARDHARLRPGMYLGSLDERALYALIYAYLDDSLQEFEAGYCDHIWLNLRDDNEVSIRDNGRGIPVHLVDGGRSFLEIMMTDGGVHRRDGVYKIVGGFFGIGLNWANALSAECVIEVAREGYLWRQAYREGLPEAEVIQERALREDEESGKTITFRPDFTILEPNDISYEVLAERLRELAYLLPGLTITLRDERGDAAKEDIFFAPNGLLDYIAFLNQPYSTLHEPIVLSDVFSFSTNDTANRTITVNIAVQYADITDTRLLGYVNTTKTAEGSHTEMLPQGILAGLHAPRWYLKVEEPFALSEILPGLTAVVKVEMSDPQLSVNFQHTAYHNFIVGGLVAHTVYGAFERFPDQDSYTLINKLLANRQALAAK